MHEVVEEMIFSRDLCNRTIMVLMGLVRATVQHLSLKHRLVDTLADLERQRKEIEVRGTSHIEHKDLEGHSIWFGRSNTLRNRVCFDFGPERKNRPPDETVDETDLLFYPSISIPFDSFIHILRRVKTPNLWLMNTISRFDNGLSGCKSGPYRKKKRSSVVTALL